MRRTPQANSTIGSFLLAIAGALHEEDIDAEPLFSAAGVTMQDAKDPDFRVAITTLRQIWAQAVEITGSCAFGLQVATHIRPTTFHALGYSLWASETLETALVRNARYQNLISDALRLQLNAHGESLDLTIDNGDPVRAWEGLDCAVAWVLVFCRELYRKPFSPQSISLMRPKPVDPARFQEFYQCPIHYAAGENRVVFPLATLREPLFGANRELAATGDRLVESYIARRRSSDIGGRVYGKLVETLATGEFSQDSVAQSMHMTTRNLQRKLALEKTSFSSLLERARRDLAQRYIDEPHLSLTDIAFLLGFSNTNSFARAFKHWFGKSPREYRTTH